MESLTAIKLITFFYILFNSGRVFSYIPQIIAVFKEQSPVLAISLVTWSFWTAANLTTALYATVVLPDPLLAAMSYGNTFGCAVVVFLVVYKRFKFNYWPKSKRNQVFAPTPVTSFTEVPNLDAEEVYHFFDVSDDSNENHTVTFSKKFKHETIESFDSFMEMTRKAEETFHTDPVENIHNETVTEDLITVKEFVEAGSLDAPQETSELPISSKKRTRKKKENVLIQVETKIDDTKQEVEIPVLEMTEPSALIDESVVISPPEPSIKPVTKKTRNPRKKK